MDKYAPAWSPGQHPTRGVVVSSRGAVACSQPLAVSAALTALAEGGSCGDAAIAASAVLAVVEPYNSHLGGDAFVIFYDARSRRTTAMNGSGAAPSRALRSAFAKGIPARGAASASVPGLVATWFDLHRVIGRLPIDRLLGPAAMYAEHGFPLGVRCAGVFNAIMSGPESGLGRSVAGSLYGLQGAARPGAIVRQPDLAWSLGQISSAGRDAFYCGSIASRIDAGMRSAGGLMRIEDLAAHQTEVTEPLRTEYCGYTIHAQPPVSQGVILIEELNILGQAGAVGWEWDSPERVHWMVEAKKLAFADRLAYMGDPRSCHPPTDVLCSKRHAATRARLIDPRAASHHARSAPIEHDTTYFCIADADGSAVSFIQSVFHGFGCGFVAPGTGILFNNRMTGFSMDRSSPNALVPGKRTMHTLNAYVVTQGDRLAWVGGTPGGDVQVQSNMQVISNVTNYSMGPQEAIEAPRWQHESSESDGGPGLLLVENRIGPETVGGLRSKGHDVRLIGPWDHASSYQMIAVDADSGAYHTGSDPRCDGHAAGI